MDACNSSRKRNETLMVGTASMQQHNERFTRFGRVLIGTRNHHREKRTTVSPEIVNVVLCDLLYQRPLPRIGARRYSFVPRRRSELAITLTELRLIAALASIGVTSPNAARGKLRAL